MEFPMFHLFGNGYNAIQLNLKMDNFSYFFFKKAQLFTAHSPWIFVEYL